MKRSADVPESSSKRRAVGGSDQPPSPPRNAPPTLDLLGPLEAERRAEEALKEKIPGWNAETAGWTQVEFMKAFEDVSLEDNRDFAIYLLKKLLSGTELNVDATAFVEFHRICCEKVKEKPAPAYEDAPRDYVPIDYNMVMVAAGIVSVQTLVLSDGVSKNVKENAEVPVGRPANNQKIKLFGRLLKVLRTLGVAGDKLMKPEMMGNNIFTNDEVKILEDPYNHGSLCHFICEKGFKIAKFTGDVKDEIFFQFK